MFTSAVLFYTVCIDARTVNCCLSVSLKQFAEIIINLKYLSEYIFKDR